MTETVETPIGQLTVDHFWPKGVSHQLFVGPKFLYALFNPRDEMHAVSRAFMTFVRQGDLPYRRLIVNEHVIDEAATRLKKKASVRNAQQFLTTIEQSDLFRIEFASEDVFVEAMETFVDWTDLGASFTDFLIHAHMLALDVDHILTFDRHFDAFDITTLPYTN